MYISKQSSSSAARVAYRLKVWSVSWIHHIEARNWIWVGNHHIVVQSHCIPVLYLEYHFLSSQPVVSIGTEQMGGFIVQVWATGIWNRPSRYGEIQHSVRRPLGMLNCYLEKIASPPATIYGDSLCSQSFLDLSEARFFTGSLMAKSGGWCSSYSGVMWQQGTWDMKSICQQLLLALAEMKRNSSSRIVKSGIFVSGELVFAHLIKNILFFLPP